MNTNRKTAVNQVEKHPHASRRAAIAVGIMFIMATISAILAVGFFAPILTGPDYLVDGAAKSSQVALGVIMDLTLALTAIGTAVGLFPFLRKYNESLALGYLAFRFLEAIIISVGVVAVLALLTLSRQYVAAAAPDTAAYQTAGDLLIARAPAKPARSSECEFHTAKV